MDISGSAALVTVARGGIARAFVADMLKRGVAKIYATRHPPRSRTANRLGGTYAAAATRGRARFNFRSQAIDQE
jgi:hypothetical protein